MPADTMITLDNGILALDLIPEWGGRTARLRALNSGTDILFPLDASGFDPINWPRGGAYPLAPYSNRIKNGKLVFQGEHFSLPAHPDSPPHTLHGVAHTLPWEVTGASAEEITIQVTYEGEHWPWTFHAEQSYQLNGSTMRQTMSMTNLGETSMPAGLGFHPYFCIDSSSRAAFVAREKWMVGADYLPAGERAPVRSTVVLHANDFRTRECVDYYAGWIGKAEIGSDAGIMTLSATGNLTHLIAFAPAGGRYLCLEPVSHVANGFNLAADGYAGTGARVLAPGETITAGIEITWQPREL
jgi:aldose 1-epimerase